MTSDDDAGLLRPRVPCAPGAVRALIVDDEPLLRTHLAHHLAQLWPELQIAGEARNGREAVDLVAQLQPDVVFLDVHMPGMNGVEAARAMGPDVQIVFVTAYEQYAVAAFYCDAARLELTEVAPHGLLAEILIDVKAATAAPTPSAASAAPGSFA